MCLSFAACFLHRNTSEMWFMFFWFFIHPDTNLDFCDGLHTKKHWESHLRKRLAMPRQSNTLQSCKSQNTLLKIKGIFTMKEPFLIPQRAFQWTVDPKIKMCLSKISMSVFLHQVCRSVSLHQCLSNGCSAVNGCRQNESLIKTSQ